MDSEGYTNIVSSYEGSPGVESRARPDDPMILSVETATEAIRAGLDPSEVEACFAQADAAREEQAALRREEEDRVVALRLAKDLDRETADVYIHLAEMADREFGEPLRFDFQNYLGAPPHERNPPRSFRTADRTAWSISQIPSTVTVQDLAHYRIKFRFPSDVYLYVPNANERADQAPAGLVAVDELTMEAGLRFPLHYAVSHLLIAWHIAPLQLTSNAWLQILGTFVLFGQHKLYRLLTPAEMNLLYRLANTKGSVGCHYIQSRSRRVVFGVPNRVHSDPGKWFWVGGKWKSADCPSSSSEQTVIELDIPTDFRLRNPSPRVPSVEQLSFDFLVVWEKIRHLPETERHVRSLNSEEARLAANLFRFPRHLSIPDKNVRRHFQPPDEMKKYSNVMNRFQELAQSKRATPLLLGSSPEKRPERLPTPPPVLESQLEVTASPESPERRLSKKKRRLVKTKDVMVAAKAAARRSPVRTRRLSRAANSGTVPSSRNGGGESHVGGSSKGAFLEGVAANVRRATDALPRVWNSDLEAIAGHQPLETVQAALTLSLQSSAMIAKAVNDLESGPNYAQLQIQLDKAVKRVGELQAEVTALGEAKTKAEADRDIADTRSSKYCELLESTMKKADEYKVVLDCIKEDNSRLRKELEVSSGEVASTKAELARRTEELAIKTGALATAAADLEAVRNEVATLTAQLKVPAPPERSPSPDAAVIGEFSYYLAFADSIRTAARAGMEVAPLVNMLKGYAQENPMHPDYPLPILDLQTVYGIDLSWYPQVAQLVLPSSEDPSTDEVDVPGEGPTAGGDGAAS
ncbi:hypothetical protein OROGR_023277 [Orobanche gracilis]